MVEDQTARPEIDENKNNNDKQYPAHSFMIQLSGLCGNEQTGQCEKAKIILEVIRFEEPLAFKSSWKDGFGNTEDDDDFLAYGHGVGDNSVAFVLRANGFQVIF